jgi:nucleoside 2-deoxyribosyltransferase
MGKSMKIYLAGHYSRKEEISKAAKDLKSVGIKVVSTWLKERVMPKISISNLSESFLQRAAIRDVKELSRATHFVLFTVSPDTLFTRGGHCWENGFADALKKKTVIVGPRQHIFHYLRGKKHFKTWKKAFQWLTKTSVVKKGKIQKIG